MSPKSRGRPPGRGRQKQSRGQHVRELSLAARALKDAHQIADLGSDVALDVEMWASEWLGAAWLGSPIGEREPEQSLCADVARRALVRPSRQALAALVALGRVAPPSAREALDGPTQSLLATQAAPGFLSAPGWTPVAGYRAVDVWQSERVLFVDFDGPTPHTLTASVLDVGGTTVTRLGVLRLGAASAWDEAHDPDEVPMPLSEHPVDEVLAELASAMRDTDMIWPRQDNEDFVAFRALTWARCRDHLPDGPDWEPIDDDERARLIDDFVSGSGLADDDVTRSLADLFLDYGDGYITAGPLCWSPGAVMVFLADWLPRKAALDAEQRTHLPETLRRWVRFALDRRGVPARWIEPVVDEVDASLPDFEEAFDDESAWGPAKSVVAALTARGVDITDRAALEEAMRQLNAENLARSLLEE
jgi:hypothetical protein